MIAATCLINFKSNMILKWLFPHMLLGWMVRLWCSPLFSNLSPVVHNTRSSFLVFISFMKLYMCSSHIHQCIGCLHVGINLIKILFVTFSCGLVYRSVDNLQSKVQNSFCSTITIVYAIFSSSMWTFAHVTPTLQNKNVFLFHILILAWSVLVPFRIWSGLNLFFTWVSLIPPQRNWFMEVMYVYIFFSMSMLGLIWKYLSYYNWFINILILHLWCWNPFID